MKEMPSTFLPCRKFIAPVLLFIFSAVTLQAQDFALATSQIRPFLNTKTFVVLEPNPLREYNILIPEITGKEWTITTAGIISYDDFLTRRRDPLCSFLILTEVYFAADRLKTKYQFLSLLMGGNYPDINQMPELCTLPLAYLDADEDTYLYKLPALLRFMQQFILRYKDRDEDIKLDTALAGVNTPRLATKTLFLLSSDVEPGLLHQIQLGKAYPYPLKIVTQEELTEAISRGDPDVAFLHKVGPVNGKMKARCYKVIMGAGDGTVYYFDYHMADEGKYNGLLRSDFQKMANFR